MLRPLYTASHVVVTLLPPPKGLRPTGLGCQSQVALFRSSFPEFPSLHGLVESEPCSWAYYVPFSIVQDLPSPEATPLLSLESVALVTPLASLLCSAFLSPVEVNVSTFWFLGDLICPCMIATLFHHSCSRSESRFYFKSLVDRNWVSRFLECPIVRAKTANLAAPVLAVMKDPWVSLKW